MGDQRTDPIIIVTDGGLVQAVCSATPGQAVVHIDYDRDEVAAVRDDGGGEVVAVPQGEGRTADAVVHVDAVAAAFPLIAAFVAQRVAAEATGLRRATSGPAADAAAGPVAAAVDGAEPVPGPWDDDGPQLDCPQCGATTVTVAATVWVKVDADCELDQAVGSGYEYDDTSPAACRSCGHRGTVMSFDPVGRD